jgi:hypothetical protein
MKIWLTTDPLMVEVPMCSSSFYLPVGWKLKSHTRMKSVKIAFIELQTFLTLDKRSDWHGDMDDLNPMASTTLGYQFHYTFFIY